MTKKVHFTDAIKRDLAGMMPTDADAIHRYTPEAFEVLAEEDQPVFFLTQLSGESTRGLKRVMFEGISDMQHKLANPKAKVNKAKVEARDVKNMKYLKESLAGWETLNKLARDGNNSALVPIEFSDESIDRFPQNLLSDLLGEISYLCGAIPRQTHKDVVIAEQIEEIKELKGSLRLADKTTVSLKREVNGLIKLNKDAKEQDSDSE